MTQAEISQTDTTTEAPSRARRGGRNARRIVRSAIDTDMLPALERKLPLVEPMDAEQVERIDRASMDILEEVGVIFRDPIALEDWRKAGADIRDDERVHFDRDMIRELISTIPETFTYNARNPQKSLPFGNDHSIFVPMTGAPFLRDLEDVRRNPDHGGFVELPQTRPHAACAPFQRTPHCRTHGPASIPSPPAHYLFVDEAFGQNIHGHDHQPQERRRCYGHVRCIVWRGISGGEPGNDRQLQR